MISSDESRERMIIDQSVEYIFRNYDFGSILKRSALEKMFQLVWPDSCSRQMHQTLNATFIAYKAIVDQELLTRHQMALRSKGQGLWEIVRPEDQANFAADVAKKKFKKAADRALAVALNIRPGILSPAQQRIADDTAARIAGIQAMASTSILFRSK